MNVPAYAIAYIRDVDFGPEIIEYIEKIEATLAPYSGRFIVHGGPIVQVEGEWTGDVVIIEFPGRDGRPGVVRLTRLPGDPAATHRALALDDRSAPRPAQGLPGRQQDRGADGRGRLVSDLQEAVLDELPDNR
ncbi:MAG TPA: DUF1330 domain-containing protein [Nocardioidaceae bacterium]|nr:DUF1330 domain-containing protein [Nocardioidaceae bacterium]